MYKIMQSSQWKADNPDIIQLYSLATPNGQKVSIALEEMALPYEAHRVHIGKDEQFADDFLEISPNNKIPAIIDPQGPNGTHHAIFESGAILLYLAEKTGLFLSKDPVKRSGTLQWLFFQMAGVGPMFGQFGHFTKFAAEKCDHPYPKERYTNEAKRLLGVMDKKLSRTKYLAGDDYSIADIATFPWVGCLDWGYGAKETLDLEAFENVVRWLKECNSRPAAERGGRVCPFD